MANEKKYLDLSGLQNFASSLLGKFALKNHNHDNSYAAKSHTHTTAQVTGLDSALAGKSPTNHNHDSVYAKTAHAHSTDNITSGILPVGRGGTGNSDGKAAANYFMNALDEGTSTPIDKDYFISQYAGGGTTTKTYHRRPVSALWAYIKSKTDSLYQPKGSYASSSHTHTIGNVTNLQSSLDGKAALSHGHSAVTQSVAGFMSAADKTKLDGIATGANKTIVDTALSSTSTNPVQNKVVNSALAGKAASSHTHTIANITSLQSTLDGKQPKGSYASSSHTHTTAQVTGLDAALAGKASTSHNHNGVYAPVSHNHDAGNITSGTLPVGRGGTGATTAAQARQNLEITPNNIGAASAYEIPYGVNEPISFVSTTNFTGSISGGNACGISIMCNITGTGYIIPPNVAAPLWQEIGYIKVRGDYNAIIINSPTSNSLYTFGTPVFAGNSYTEVPITLAKAWRPGDGYGSWPFDATLLKVKYRP